MKMLVQSIALLLVIIAISLASDLIVRDRDDDVSDSPASKTKAQMFNFASQAAGAVVLDKSPASAKGYHNLLNDDKDKYGISPCDEKKWVVIGLSEEVLITSVELLNYEKYSSMLRDFQLLASSSYPTDEWINLGTYTAMPQLGSQSFNITDLSEAHTRYLKVKFLTHYSDEALCTLSQIKVFGMTVIAAFQQEVQRSDHSMRDMLSQLNSEQPTAQLLEAIADSTAAEESASHGEGTQQGEGVSEPGNETATASEVVPADTVPVGSNTSSEEQPDAGLQSENTPTEDSNPDSAAIVTSDESVSAVAVDGDSASVAPDLVSGDGNTSAVSPSSSTANTTEDTKEGALDVANDTSPLVANKSEAPPVPAPQSEDEPDSPRFGSFDLAGKVKKLLPGLFSAPETPIEDTPTKLAEEIKIDKAEETVGSATAEGGANEGVARLTSTSVSEACVAANDSTHTIAVVTSTNSSEQECSTGSAPASAESGDSNLEEVPTSAGTATDAAVASAHNNSEEAEPSAALNSSKPADTVSVEVNSTLAAVKHEVTNATTEIPPGPATTAPPADRAVNRSSEAPPKANLSTAVTQSPGTAKLSSTNVSANGTLGAVVNPLPTAASTAASNATLHCLDTLSFADFSRKMRAKLQQYSANNSTGANSTAADDALSGKESNVFKSLMQKIKTLEMNSAIVEMYAVQVKIPMFFRNLVFSKANVS
jgi:hypothetical protein